MLKFWWVCLKTGSRMGKETETRIAPALYATTYLLFGFTCEVDMDVSWLEREGAPE